MLLLMQYTWFKFLEKNFPATSFGNVLLRVFVDQTCMCPVGLAIFFTFMALTEGGGQKALKRKFQEVDSLLSRLTYRDIFLR